MKNLPGARVDAAHIQTTNEHVVYCVPVLRIFNYSLVEEIFSYSTSILQFFSPLCDVDIVARSCIQLEKKKKVKKASELVLSTQRSNPLCCSLMCGCVCVWNEKGRAQTLPLIPAAHQQLSFFIPLFFLHFLLRLLVADARRRLLQPRASEEADEAGRYVDVRL